MLSTYSFLQTEAQCLKCIFNIDIETCPHCQGPVKIISCIDDPAVIQKILTHLTEKAPAHPAGHFPAMLGAAPAPEVVRDSLTSGMPLCLSAAAGPPDFPKSQNADQYFLDTFAWMVKALGSSRDEKYKALIVEIANTSKSSFVARHARESLHKYYDTPSK